MIGEGVLGASRTDPISGDCDGISLGAPLTEMIGEGVLGASRTEPISGDCDGISLGAPLTEMIGEGVLGASRTDPISGDCDGISLGAPLTAMMGSAITSPAPTTLCHQTASRVHLGSLRFDSDIETPEAFPEGARHQPAICFRPQES